MKTILIADDSSTMRRSLTMSLELSGYKVVPAEDGQAALDALRAGLQPDMVLTDIMMPRLDGIGLIREARKLLRFTPIVALTTQGQRDLREQAKAAGATAWMIKPVGGNELAALLREYLGNTA
jgi:two-component system chemotaxis response regulator CheY